MTSKGFNSCSNIAENPPTSGYRNDKVVAKKGPLPAHLQFVAGGIAGVSEILVMYPLDVVKTRFQLQVGKGGADGYTSMADCFRKMVRKEGIWAIYRGILAPVLVEAPKRATKFGSNEFYSRLYMKALSTPTMTQPLSVLTGISAGVTEAFLIVSFELVKIRMQDKNNIAMYKNTMDVVRKVYSQQGVFGFFKGLEATMWRNAVWNGTYFGLIHRVRTTLPQASTKEDVTLRNFTAGTIGGIIATTLNTPFDVAKTRVQGQLPHVSPKYIWTLPALKKICKEEGFRALYKGFLPKVLRLGPGGGILLVVYDYTISWMKTHLRYDD